MVIWSGWGILVIPIAATMSFLGVGIASSVGLSAQMGLIVGCALAGVPIWFAGRRLNRPVDGYHPRTGERVVYKDQHTLFWIPMQHYAFIAVILGIYLMIIGAGSSSG